LDHLLALGEITREEADAIAARRHEALEKDLSAAQSEKAHLPAAPRRGLWAKIIGGPEPEDDNPKTGVDTATLKEFLAAQARVPEGFRPHAKIRKMLQAREEMARGEQPLDWSNAEALAFATLSCEGVRIRLSGQDSQRGTFSQRHSVMHDTQDGKTWMPLRHLRPSQAPIDIINSPLSESAVVGFEYGYSLDAPDALVMWEAQFGDFWNVAQPFVDQFLASAEDKWQRLSGMVLLLPHGFEGQGPEHSSARLERFLHLAAEDNIQVIYPSTPAQYFHALRKQAIRLWRKPLVIMTPKSLLRNPSAVSRLEELAGGTFQPVISSPTQDAAEVRSVLLCMGKLFYELEEYRAQNNLRGVEIIRLEQLYPLPQKALEKELAKFDPSVPLTWVQEEPENMGAWTYLRVKFGYMIFGHSFSGVTRPASASPATGSMKRHKFEQADVISRAFAEQARIKS
jgi:2-oxoglutarate dehydrogenase E1 component